MNAITLCKSCLLACSVLAGTQALAGPMSLAQGTVNSIEFSFMNYGSTPSPYFNSVTAASIGGTPAGAGGSSAPSVLPTPGPAEPAAAPALPPASAADIQPAAAIFLPTAAGPAGTLAPVETAAAPQALAAIPLPGSAALFGLGFALLLLRRREGFHA